MKAEDFVSMKDLSSKELGKLIKLGQQLKIRKQSNALGGKNIGLYFEKPSTRTKVSFEVGVKQLGGDVIHLNPAEMQISRGESVKDTAKVLSKYLDCIVARVFNHNSLVELAKYAEIPVINALSDFSHPCQGLADMQTVQEIKGDLSELKVAWVGDGNNVCHSLIYACAKTNTEISIATPKGYEPAKDVVAYYKNAELTNDPKEAVNDADVIITDTWVSMGKEKEKAQRLKIFKDFKVDKNLVKHANKDFIFMHCLPAYRGYEVSAEIIDGKHSAVWEEAENKLHSQKALLSSLLL